MGPFDLVCRTCGEEAEPSTSLLLEKLAGTRNWVLKNMGLKIEDDGKLPHCICSLCLIRISDWIAFTNQYKLIQQKFLKPPTPTSTPTPSSAVSTLAKKTVTFNDEVITVEIEKVPPIIDHGLRKSTRLKLISKAKEKLAKKAIKNTGKKSIRGINRLITSKQIPVKKTLQKSRPISKKQSPIKNEICTLEESFTNEIGNLPKQRKRDPKQFDGDITGDLYEVLLDQALGDEIDPDESCKKSIKSPAKSEKKGIKQRKTGTTTKADNNMVLPISVKVEKKDCDESQNKETAKKDLKSPCKSENVVTKTKVGDKNKTKTPLSARVEKEDCDESQNEKIAKTDLKSTCKSENVVKKRKVCNKNQTKTPRKKIKSTQSELETTTTLKSGFTTTAPVQPVEIPLPIKIKDKRSPKKKLLEKNLSENDTNSEQVQIPSEVRMMPPLEKVKPKAIIVPRLPNEHSGFSTSEVQSSQTSTLLPVSSEILNVPNPSYNHNIYNMGPRISEHMNYTKPESLQCTTPVLAPMNPTNYPQMMTTTSNLPVRMSMQPGNILNPSSNMSAPPSNMANTPMSYSANPANNLSHSQGHISNSSNPGNNLSNLQHSNMSNSPNVMSNAPNPPANVSNPQSRVSNSHNFMSNSPNPPNNATNPHGNNVSNPPNPHTNLTQSRVSNSHNFMSNSPNPPNNPHGNNISNPPNLMSNTPNPPSYVTNPLVNNVLNSPNLMSNSPNPPTNVSNPNNITNPPGNTYPTSYPNIKSETSSPKPGFNTYNSVGNYHQPFYYPTNNYYPNNPPMYPPNNTYYPSNQVFRPTVASHPPTFRPTNQALRPTNPNAFIPNFYNNPTPYEYQFNNSYPTNQSVYYPNTTTATNQQQNYDENKKLEAANALLTFTYDDKQGQQ